MELIKNVKNMASSGDIDISTLRKLLGDDSSKPFLAEWLIVEGDGAKSALAKLKSKLSLMDGTKDLIADIDEVVRIKKDYTNILKELLP
jgi:hypothetical protein